MSLKKYELQIHRYQVSGGRHVSKYKILDCVDGFLLVKDKAEKRIHLMSLDYVNRISGEAHFVKKNKRKK